MLKAIVSSLLFFSLVAGVFSMCAAQEAPLKTSQTTEPQPAKQLEGKTKETIPQTNLEEVVVTATAIPTPAKELPVPVQVITRKEIEESRANDLSELLTEYLPEHFQKYPGALSSVSIRGFRTDATGTDIKGHVLVLIDGHRAGTGNVAVLPMENVERIEVVRGPGSVIYGSAAMGGVINIITRRGKGTPSVNGGVEGGSWNYIKGYGGTSGSLFNDKVGFSFTGRTIRQDSYNAGGGAKVPNTGYNDEAYSLSLLANPHPDHTFFAVGNYYHGWDIGTPDPTYFAPNLTDNKGLYRGYGSLAYDGAFPDCDLNWHLSYYNVVDKPTWNYPLLTYGYSSTTTGTNTQGVRSSFTLPTFSLGRLLLGFQWDGIGVSNSTQPSGFNYSPDSHYNDYALLAEEKIVWNKWTLLLGARYDYFNETTLPTAGLDVVSQNEAFDHTSWRTGLTYSFLDWLTGRVAVGTGFRAPTADELSGSFQSGQWMKIAGNPGLSPETSTTYDVGVNVEYAGFSGEIGWFYTDYTNAITPGFPICVNGDCSWTTYRNVAGANWSAIEALLNYKNSFNCYDMPISLRPYLNLVYYTQRELNDTSLANILHTTTVPYEPLWDITGGLELGFNKKVSLLFTGFYVGPEKQQDFNYLSPTYSQAIDGGGFVVWGAKLTIHPMKYFDLYLSVDNLTDKNYAFVDGYPMPGRTFRGGIQARF
jgi:vitamin B12 transporter